MDGLTSRQPVLRRCHVALLVSLCALALPASASSLEQAKRIYDRLVGTPPSAVELADMKAKIDGNDFIGAANYAIDHPDLSNNPHNPGFYNVTLKNWVTPWTNRDGNKFAPLNDYTATVIGVIRDGVDYRKILFDDILYVPNSGTYGNYSTTNNNAYVAAEAANADLSSSSVLGGSTLQSALNGLPASATAGVLTSRAAARAFFIDGTNRAMFRFTLKNHLCHDMEQVMDTTRPTDRIRRDVSRSPGGDSRIFMNSCVGCHSGMDPMAQAFAFYNFSYDKATADASSNPDAIKDTGQLVYRDAVPLSTPLAHDPTHPEKSARPSGTQEKYHINENHFVEGYETLDDKWDNYWRSGPNTAIFGWDSGLTGTGTGAKSLGQELANTEAFAVCSVKKVFKVVCLRDPSESDRSATVHGVGGFNQMLTNFKTSHNLKNTFAEAAVYCSGN